MTEADKKFVISGRFGAPHGIRGWIKIHSETNPIKALIGYQPLYLETQNGWQAFDLIDSRQDKDYLVVGIKGYNDRDQVKALTGKSIAVLREQLPALPDDEFYWTDLEAMTVITEDGILLGKVKHLFSTGSNDVMVIEGKKKHLIPFLRETFVKSINRDEKEIIVDWDPEF